MTQIPLDQRPIIVAGLGRLGLRVVLLLREKGVPVRIITDATALSWHVRRATDAGAQLFTGDFQDPALWETAGVQQCQAAIVTGSHHGRNLETSIRVKRLAPDLRIVARVDAPHLGPRLQQNFGLHAALCPAALSASHFVKTALEASNTPSPLPHKRPAIRDRRGSWQLWVLGVLGSCLLMGTLAFHFGKGLGWLDALYFTITILTTVGFGDFSLHADPAWLKILGMGLMLAGFILIALLVSLFSHFLLTGEASRQHHERNARRQKNHVIVIGMGSLGMAVVRDLHERRQSVVIIEQNPATAETAAELYRVPVILGDATQAETLLRAGLDQARAVMTLTSSDGVNLEICLRASTLADQHRPDAPLPVVISCQDELLGARLRSASPAFHPLSPAEIGAPTLVETALNLQAG